ncbi:MAG: hypothetical protein Q8P67_25740 [archaeon]|nr:hypothetical protein [archaeon]
MANIEPYHGTNVPRCEKLSSLETQTIGTYGGGDALSMAPVACARRYGMSWTSAEGPNEPREGAGEVRLAVAFREQICGELNATYARLADTPPEDQLYPLPPQPLRAEDLRFSFSLVFSGASPSWEPSGAELHSHNVFAQAWLFSAELDHEPERLGISRWPLCGLFHSFNVKVDPASCQSIGLHAFTPADQHCHYVEDLLEIDGELLELNDWHVGSDTARFRIVASPSNLSSGLFVIFDLETRRCEITLIFIDHDSRRLAQMRELCQDLPERASPSQVLHLAKSLALFPPGYRLPPVLSPIVPDQFWEN